MRNVDKYLAEILTCRRNFNCFINELRNGTNKDDGCIEKDCVECQNKNQEWLEAEYAEPEVDWSNVEQGTKVCARNDIVGKFVSKYNKVIVLNIDGCYLGYHEDVCRLEK